MKVKKHILCNSPDRTLCNFSKDGISKLIKTSSSSPGQSIWKINMQVILGKAQTAKWIWFHKLSQLFAITGSIPKPSLLEASRISNSLVNCNSITTIQYLSVEPMAGQQTHFQCTKSAVPKLITLISDVLLAWWDIRIHCTCTQIQMAPSVDKVAFETDWLTLFHLKGLRDCQILATDLKILTFPPWLCFTCKG